MDLIQCVDSLNSKNQYIYYKQCHEENYMGVTYMDNDVKSLNI